MKDVRIADLLSSNGEYADFIKFCADTGKTLTSELTEQDYSLFCSRCGHTQEEAERIKSVIEACNADNGELTSKEPKDKTCLRDYIAQIMQNEKDRFQVKPVALEINEQSREAEIPLFRLFNINPEPYCKIPLQKENVGVRACNGLRAGKKKDGSVIECKTVGELLKLTPLEILGYKHMGALSLMHIITLLPQVLHSINIGAETASLSQQIELSDDCKKQISKMMRGKKYNMSKLSEADKLAFLKYLQSYELIGKEIASAAVSNNPSIDTIAQMLQNFYDKPIKFCDKKAQFEQSASLLSPDIKKMPIKPFITAYRVSAPIDLRSIGFEITDSMTVSDFINAVLNDTSENTRALDSAATVVGWLNFDLAALCKPIRSCFERQSENMRFILMQRIEGKTLNKIGDVIGVTRERVRQIEKDLARKLSYLYGLQKRYHDIFAVMYALQGGEKVLFYEDVTSKVGEVEAKILWYLAKKGLVNCAAYHFSPTSNAIIFGQTLEPVILSSLINKLPEFFDEHEMKRYSAEFIKKYGVSERVINRQVKLVYKRTGSIYHRESFTKTAMCEYILRTKFPDGFKIANKSDYDRFCTYSKGFLDEKEAITCRALDAKISQIGILIARGKYTHPSYVKIDKKIVDEINNYIKNNSRVLLSYNELFKAFADKLKKVGIKNRYCLHGVLKMVGCPFIMRKDYITKEPDLNLAAEFENFVKRKGRVHKSEILKEFNGLSEINISLFCQRLTSIVVLGGGWYVYCTRFDITPKDYDEQRKFLLEVCGEMPVSTRALYDRYLAKFGEFTEKNEIRSQSDLFGILKFMFRKEFYFSRPYVSVNSKEELTHHSVLRRRLDGINSIEIDNLLELCKKNGIHFISIRTLIKSLEPDFVRINKTTLMKQDFVGLNEGIIAYVAQVIQDKVKAYNGICASKNITDFKKFPAINVPWNTFLLESTASLAGDVLNVLRISTSSIYASADVYVGGDYIEEDLPSLIVRVLVEQHTKEPFKTKEALYKWLRRIGLCNVRLPAFLEANGYISYDEDGRLLVRDVKKEK